MSSTFLLKAGLEPAVFLNCSKNLKKLGQVFGLIGYRHGP